MNVGAYSNLAMVTTWLFYLLAMALFGVEWAMARRVPADAAEAESAPVPALVGAGGSPDAPVIRSRVDPLPAPAPEASDRWGRMALALAGVGLLTNVVGVVLRGVAADRFPWGNMYEFTITTVAFIMAIFVVLAARFGMRRLGLPVTLLVTVATGLAVEVFYVAVADLVPALHSVWFVVHIVAASFAGALFNVAGAVSALYLLRSRADARGTTRGWLAQLPTPRRLDLWAYRATAIGFPLWTFAVAAGAVWAQYAWGRFWGWDPKETFSLITWVVFAAYLHARLTAGWKGARAARIAVAGVACFWFNFIGVNLLFSGLHSYAGI